MYAKLMLRGLLRHTKSSRRLFLLLMLCCLAIMFCLGFRDSMNKQYRQTGVDLVTSHLQIVPADSPKNRADSFADHRQGLVFLDYSQKLRDHLAGMPQVEAAMPLIETGATYFDLEGDATGYSSQLKGVDPFLLEKVLPGVKVTEGTPGLAWEPSMAEVPVYRPKPGLGEDLGNGDRFQRDNFRPQDQAWKDFKAQVRARWPVLFEGSVAQGAGAAADKGTGADLDPAKAAQADDDAFLADLDRALERNDLSSVLAPPADSDYDWKVDDALAALKAEEAHPASGELAKRHLKMVRKKLFQALMPDEMRRVWSFMGAGTSYTMAVPPARDTDLLGQPAVIPIRLAAYVEFLPLYFFDFYVDNQVLRSYLDIGPEQCTSVMIRLKDGSQTQAVKAELAAWIQAQGLDWVVKDSGELGQIFLSTAVAFDVIILVILVLMTVTVVIFVVNSITLSLMKRRREIGTSIALGLSPGQNGLIIFGEMGFLVTASWLAAAVLGTALELVLAQWGLPGMIFFPGDLLYFDYSPLHALGSLGIVLGVTLGASAFALRKTRKLRAVDLLKEAS